MSFLATGPALLVRAGWIGVDMFFVISGFVIGLSALQGYDREGPPFRAAFARRRIARIVPLYVLTCLIFLLPVDPSLLGLPLRQLALHLGSHALFLHNLSPATHGSINGPNWSVALEMQFYAAMALATPLLARATLGWWCPRWWWSRGRGAPRSRRS
jgi:peptidoglycan/LPS O-acetylase OafA/YrhL